MNNIFGSRKVLDAVLMQQRRKEERKVVQLSCISYTVELQSSNSENYGQLINSAEYYNDWRICGTFQRD